MIVKSKILELNKWLFVEEVLDEYIPENPLIENRSKINVGSIEMENFQLSTSGLFILQSRMNFAKPVHFQTEIEGEAVTSQFIFYRPLNASRKQERSRHNIRYIPSFNSVQEVREGFEYTYFIAVLSKSYYLNLIKRESLLHRNFIKELDRGRYVSYAKEDQCATFEMQQAIAELVDCRKLGEIRRLHTESRILSLLMYQFEQYFQQAPSVSEPFNQEDIQRLEKAKGILDNRISNPPTQKELAAEVLTSESKLRKDFKRYFSMTIHDYLTRIRMEQAKAYLLVERLPVYEVASLTGYGHQNNFSSAFKKYYGVSPVDIKE